MQSKAELLSLQQIRCFCAALELGSFTAAAEALRVSQPAVAEQIRKLEQALGADLFVRAGRGVVPTEAGRAFAEHAARSLRAVEDAADSVGELTALRSGTVALGVFGEPVGLAPRRARRRVPAPPSRTSRCGSSAATPRRSPTASGAASSRPASCCCRSTTTSSTSARSCATRSSTSAPIPSARAQPATIERLAATPLVFYDAESADSDPIRRQLAERAQALGRPPAAEGRGGAQGHRAAARRRRHRRHLPPERLHARAVLPRGPDHGAVQPGALRHVRDHHPPRRAALARRARAARATSRRTCAPSPTSSTARAERHRVGR